MSTTPILYVASWGRKIYGGERILLNTFEHIDRSTYRPIAALNSTGELYRLLVERGESVTPVKYDWLRVDPKPALFSSTLGVLRGARQLRRLIRENSVGLVHVLDGEALQAAYLAAYWSGIPLVFTMNNDVPYPQLNQWILRRTPAVIAYSKAVVARLRTFGLSEPHMRYFVMGIDARPYMTGNGSRVRCELGIPLDAPLIGVVASLQRRKRQDVLLRAVPMILGQCADAQFVLIGDDPTAAGDQPGYYETELRRLADDLGIRDRVIFAGFRDDTPDIWHAIDVAVACSDEEALGICNLEAMAAGKPVVATEVGGIVDVIVDKENGLLFPPGDHVALGTRVNALLADPILRQKLGEAGRQAVLSRFCVETYVRANEHLYAELLHR